MKNIATTYLLILFFLLPASCSEDVLDINTDPNNPTSVGPDLLLPVAHSYSALVQESYDGQNKLGNYMMYN